MKQNLIVVIPAYNESGHLRPVLDELVQSGRRVLVIDDGSTDGTADLARSAGATVINNPVNQGKGVAVQRAIEALAHEDVEWVVLMDADGQHAPADIARFEEAARDGKGDFLCGSRFATRPASMPPLRFWTNCFLSWVMSGILRQKIQDPQCGFRMISKNFFIRMRLSASRFEIDNDLLFEAVRLNARIVNVPVQCIYNNKKSHIRPVWDTVRLIRFIWPRISWRYRFAVKRDQK